MDTKTNENTPQESIEKKRRVFLKKAIYSAPTLVTLGYLARPTSAFAESAPVGTPCSDDVNNPYGYPPCS